MSSYNFSFPREKKDIAPYFKLYFVREKNHAWPIHFPKGLHNNSENLFYVTQLPESESPTKNNYCLLFNRTTMCMTQVVN